MYDSDFVPVSGGLAGLQAAISDTYFPLKVEGARLADEVQGVMATASMGPLSWTSIHVSGPFFTRRQLVAAADARSNYVLMLLLEGGHVALQDKCRVVVGPGDLILLNANRPLESEQRAAGTSVSISFPASLLRSRFLEVDDWCMVPLNTSQGAAAILRESMLSCWRNRASISSISGNNLASSILHVLAAAFRSGVNSPVFESRSATLHFLRVRELVAAHLDNPELSVDFVADRLYISKSYLFSIMNAANTTLGHYILERRLDRSRELLSDPSLKHRSIGEIAFSVGFQELSHFSRRFSERFGKSPRAFRVSACHCAGGHD